MAETFDLAASTLLCTENDEDGGRILSYDPNGSNSSIRFPLLSEEIVRNMIGKEREHLPKDDYLMRLRCGDLDMSVRREAIEWIWKAHTHYGFGPSTVCLAMNYFDRFLSLHEMPKGRSWALQLLAVACLSLAAKMEETEAPLCVDLQISVFGKVGDPQFVFDGKTIQRMELMILATLNWKLQVCTPLSFIDYFLRKINDDQNPSMSSISRSAQLTLSTIRGIDFLEFSPSEIAAAVALSVSREILAQTEPYFVHVEKERVMKCVELINDLLVNKRNAVTLDGGGSVSSVPQSPNGVLEAACLSYITDEIIVG